MAQANRKAKSLEQSLAEQRATDGEVVDVGGGLLVTRGELDRLNKELEKDMQREGGGGSRRGPVGVSAQLLVQPNEEQLLKLAGGSKDMIHKTGKEGLELRTVLAQRVSLVST